MKIRAKHVISAYAVIALLTFGWAANEKRICLDSMTFGWRECANSDHVFAGLVAGSFWPLYWSWTIVDAVHK